ncbi:hypothetical protein [Magnetospirillum aberrantis]|uniref:Uncharacterized protein n=1 Tax=Magnetospirillum aberrantis SpK TaxID=908842 RepID=A0A7C9QTU7_9PROT|nr:hypothetical protein [Magnetospirillum aberrantis]NFV79981.1 hypothetical protein [Magnetospirillum aberrantis SpK]
MNKSGLDKAKSLVRHHLDQGRSVGGVSLTLYADAVQYATHHPGEDFAEHQRQRAELVAWLAAQQITVIDIPVSAQERADSATLAERAVLSTNGAAIGLNIGYQQDQGGAYVGWALTAPRHISKGER